MELLLQKALENGANQEIITVLNEHADILDQHTAALSQVNTVFWLLLFVIAGVGFFNVWYASQLGKKRIDVQ